jgi:hypothetical protein
LESQNEFSDHCFPMKKPSEGKPMAHKRKSKRGKRK